jgi:hypothetical protein
VLGASLIRPGWSEVGNRGFGAAAYGDASMRCHSSIADSGGGVTNGS